MDHIPEQVYDFVVELSNKHQKIKPQDENWLEIRQQLAFAGALLRHHLKKDGFKDHPIHIVVVGPTQVGKSSIVNLVLGTDAATTSPLAGFTRHAQGFTQTELTDRQLTDIATLLPDWKKLSQQNLTDYQLDAWSLEQLSHPALLPGNTIIWDTPDFDSVSSRDYRSVVPVLCAIADCIVLTVSKEKYADQSVWQLLRMISSLQKPLLVCFNKTSPGHETELKDAMLERLQNENIKYCNIITLPYSTRENSPFSATDAKQLHNSLADCLSAGPAITTTPVLLEWLQAHWSQWLAPVREENRAQALWLDLQQQYINEFLAYYQQHYHQEAAFSETLQKAVKQLLELLEIPIIAGTLGNMRKIITWPARQLGGLIKNRVGQTKTPDNLEQDIILEANRHAWLSMQNRVVSQAHEQPAMQQWWQQLAKRIGAEMLPVSEQLESVITNYQTAFEPEINIAANQLYEYLQENPRTLNTLRATRATTDAIAVIIAIKTGGIGVNDLILAPALLSVTSLLAESAVGSRMKQIEKSLKDKQIQLLSDYLITQTMLPLLADFSTTLDYNNLYQIDAERVTDVENIVMPNHQDHNQHG